MPKSPLLAIIQRFTLYQRKENTMPERDAPLNADEMPSLQAESRSVKTEADSLQSSRADLTNKRFLSAIWPAIAVLILCIVGLSIWNNALVETSRQQQDLIQDAQQRLSLLEKQLSSSDESMTQSSVVMQVRLKDIETRTEELWTQMDKLWAAAWRRNQTEIADHGKRLDAFDESMIKQNKTLIALDMQLTKEQKSLSRLKAENVKLAKNIKVFTAKEKELLALKTQINDQLQGNKLLQKKIDDNQQWQQSNNAFRLQTNKTLARLEKQIKPLLPTKAAASPSTNNK